MADRDLLRDVAHQVRQGTQLCPGGAPAHSQIIGGIADPYVPPECRSSLNVAFVTDGGRGWICARVYDEPSGLRAVRYDRDGRTVEQLAKPATDPLCVVDVASWLIQAITAASLEEQPNPDVRFYLVRAGGPAREVTKADYVAAERAAGLRNTLGQPDEPATWSFSVPGVEGFQRVVPGA